LQALDKGKAAAVTTRVTTKDKYSGEEIFEAISTIFVRGSGGFGGKRVGNGMISFALKVFKLIFGKDLGPATASNIPPKRKPDAIVEEKTLPSQAALYRCVFLAVCIKIGQPLNTLF